MSDCKVIRLHGETAEVPLSTEPKHVSAQVLPFRTANDRRGKYKELRALIDAGLDLEVSVEKMD